MRGWWSPAKRWSRERGPAQGARSALGVCCDTHAGARAAKRKPVRAVILAAGAAGLGGLGYERRRRGRVSGRPRSRQNAAVAGSGMFWT